jgi:hypothetical protein
LVLPSGWLCQWEEKNRRKAQPQLMKKLTKTLLLLIFASALTATTVFGQLVTIKFDENGNVTLNGTPAAPGTRGVDPLSGMEGLKYNAAGLGVPWIPGDVLLVEPPQPGVVTPYTVAPYSDLVRFSINPATGLADAIYFFSLADEDPPTLADVPVLPSPQANNFVIDEVGPEGNNGAFYWPTANQPGYVTVAPYAGAVAYNIISDVPEPSALALLGLAGGLLAVLRRRQ